MRSVDYGKAAGVALLILALDLAIAFLVVLGWSLMVEPGHPSAHYTSLAPRLSTVSTRIAGPILFALLVWRFGRRRARPFLFGLAVFVGYFVLDGATVGFRPFFFTLPVLLTMTLKLAGAMIGAALAARSVEKAPGGR